MLYYHGGVEGCAETPNASIHIDTPHVSRTIILSTVKPDGRASRVITFQADGDELDAILWGLDNYKDVM